MADGLAGRRRVREGERGNVLSGFLPPLACWFREKFGEPTAPQRLGWPEIGAGRNTLIVSPTGSGKTLAAFLACLDHLWRNPREERGVRILYISPLKALNQDVSRNLEAPLAEIQATAKALGTPLPGLGVGVRTGDTPQSERQKMARRPPEILITTPESLHLLLTSKARATLRGVSHVLVDEIHALAPNKRGVFLSLLLERLEGEVAEGGGPGFVRVGLSATQRPLEEVARYLGGRRRVRGRGGRVAYEPRPVTIVDAGQTKALDLEVSLPATGPAEGVWPAIEARLMELIGSHRSTIVFANNRRVAERLTARLNELADEEAEPGAEPSAMVRAHHGSLSQEARRATEEALKAGELAAVVSTASLEMGIDMGAVDLVCQVESPGGVARGLQRVGRSGHVVGRTSKGRLLAKTRGDLLESAALAGAMRRGEVERLRTPTNCLDILAQQVVACVATRRWAVGELFDLVRQAYPYRDLTAEAFEGVLGMVSGRFRVESLRDLRPRLVWDRVHNTLHPLPGTAQLAVVGGGAIPDTGQYPLHLGSAEGPRLGELDEEFVLERRVGESFRLGSSSWRIESIDPLRVIVSASGGSSTLMPFWRGEGVGRTAELGEAVGRLSRSIVERLDDPEAAGWLERDCALDRGSAEALVRFVGRQARLAGAVPDDRTVLVESYRDESGETGLAILTPLGTKLNHALKLCLQARLRARLGIEVACLHGDDGVLVRLPGMDEPPLDVFEGLTPEVAEDLIRHELGESALFGLRFRQNAGRALLMPRPDPGKRTPLYLQRLRAKDLLQAVRRFPDFPIVVETFRECLDDDLDLPRLRALLSGIADGSVRVVGRRGEVPSPFASELVFAFSRAFLYEWDTPKRPDRPTVPLVDEDVLDPLLRPGAEAGEWLDETAVDRLERRLRGAGRPPRTVDEMAEWLGRLGDLVGSEIGGPMAGFLEVLESSGRAARIRLEGTSEPDRWIGVEDAGEYAQAFGSAGSEQGEPLRRIVLRYLRTRALVGLDELRARYPIEPGIGTELLEELVEAGELVRLGAEGEAQWSDRRNLEEARRLTLALRRGESVAVPPEVYVDWVLRRQHAHPAARLEGSAALGLVLARLQGFGAPLEVWESEILPARISGLTRGALDAELSGAGWSVRALGESRGSLRLAFTDRDFPAAWPGAEPESPLGEDEARTLEALRGRGALYVDELSRGSGLSPSTCRRALGALLARGLATVDRLDAMREGPGEVNLASASAALGRRGRPRLGSLRNRATARAKPRWSALEIGGEGGDPESDALAWASALLDRYGVLSRETVGAEPSAPPWRVLAPLLARAELRGELRRGYFVEGLSGVQYAEAETAEALARAGVPDGRPTLLSTLDPANLYGSGAPLDVPLLEGGTARLSRSASNVLVLAAGRPVLIVEGNGRRLTDLGGASEEEIRAALALLPGLAGPGRRTLKVETYNNAAALASPAAPWLLEVGFVRDHPGLAYYAGW